MDVDQSSDQKKSMLILIGIGGGIFVLLIMVVIFMALSNRGNTEGNNQQTAQDTTTNGSNNQQVPPPSETPLPTQPENLSEVLKLPGAEIAVVGEETIYQEDLETESRNYIRTEEDNDVSSILMDKLINDSITLQAAAEEGYIELTSDVFNSPEKDYVQRASLVNRAKGEVEKNAAGISGSVVALWFYQDGRPGLIGYEKGEEIAIETITDLHEQVKNGEITMLEAGSLISDDDSLGQVDNSFQSNAFFQFTSVGPSESISYDPEFDEIIRGLNEEEITEVYIGKHTYIEPIDVDLGNLEQGVDQIDAVAMFGQVTKINEGYTNFDEWLQAQKNNYETEIY